MSVRVVAQLALVAGTAEAAAQELARELSCCAADVPELRGAHAGVNGPGSQGGGELTLDLLFASEADCASLLSRSDKTPGLGLVAALGASLRSQHALIANTDAVAVDVLEEHVGVPGLAGIKRTLLLRVHEGTPADQTAAFERDMLDMAAYVPAIRNFCFGRVRTSPPNPGASRWTHVWEQEFENVDGLLVDYMASPYHWGYLDAWYNPEQPQAIVDVWLAHVYCPATESVLSWTSER